MSASAASSRNGPVALAQYRCGIIACTRSGNPAPGCTTLTTVGSPKLAVSGPEYLTDRSQSRPGSATAHRCRAYPMPTWSMVVALGGSTPNGSTAQTSVPAVVSEPWPWSWCSLGVASSSAFVSRAAISARNAAGRPSSGRASWVGAAEPPVSSTFSRPTTATVASTTSTASHR